MKLTLRTPCNFLVFFVVKSLNTKDTKKLHKEHNAFKIYLETQAKKKPCKSLQGFFPV